MNRRLGTRIQKILESVNNGNLKEPFSPQEVRKATDFPSAGNFLPKHRVGNPGGNTELFVQVSQRPALYRLNRDYFSCS